MASAAEIANDLAAKSKMTIRNAHDKGVVHSSMMRGAETIRTMIERYADLEAKFETLEGQFKRYRMGKD